MSPPNNDRLIDAFVTTPALAELFSDDSVLGAMLDFEAALATVEGRAGVIPAGAADAVSYTHLTLPTNREV